MKFLQRILFIFALVCSAFFIQAQTDTLSFNFDCEDGFVGDTVCVTVTVDNFTNVSSDRKSVV